MSAATDALKAELVTVNATVMALVAKITELEAQVAAGATDAAELPGILDTARAINAAGTAVLPPPV